MDDFRIRVQRRMIEWDGEMIPEFIFNETDVDYLKLVNRQLSKEELPCYYTEDRLVYGIYLGKRFNARLFRIQGSWFYGQQSYGVELAFCLTLFFKVLFYKLAQFDKPDTPMLMCYNTDGYYMEKSSRHNYCYVPTDTSGIKEAFIPHGSECPNRNIIFAKGDSVSFWHDEKVVVGDYPCLACPFNKNNHVVSDKNLYVHCKVPRFAGWPQDEYLFPSDYDEILRRTLEKENKG